MTDLVEDVASRTWALVNVFDTWWSEHDKARKDQHRFFTQLTFSALDAEGYAIVPKEPTEDMREGGDAAILQLQRQEMLSSPKVYRAMLLAAPSVLIR